MTITPVGFGAWAIGGGDWTFGWGAQDDEKSVAAIRHAVERGINWVDTAAIYGLGHSEEIVGAALKQIPAGSRPLVFTKCGLIWDENDRQAMPKQVGAPESIRRECEQSLRASASSASTSTRCTGPRRDGTPIEGYWGALVELKKQGKVRAIGLSNHNVAQLEAAERIGHVDTLQPPFSAIRREFAENELPWCREHETGVIVYSPMQAGLLTGGFTEARAKTLPKDDWRSRDEEFTGDKLKRNLTLAATMKAVADRHGTTAAAVAVAWTLAWPGVTGAIVGARAPEQIDGWIDAATLSLTAADLKEIAATIKATGAGSGPALPPDVA